MEAGDGEGGGVSGSVATQEDYRRLFDYCVGFATQMLADSKAFYPFGAQIGCDGKLGAVGADAGEEHPAPGTVIDILIKGFSDAVAANRIRACCLCFDGTWRPNAEGEKSDAVICIVEHCDGGTIRFAVPYAISDGRQVTTRTPIAEELSIKQFPWRSTPPNAG